MTHSIQASLLPVALTATLPAVQILLGAYCMLGGACDRQHNEYFVEFCMCTERDYILLLLREMETGYSAI